MLHGLSDSRFVLFLLVSVLLAAFAVFIGLVMCTVGSHKMMLVGRCQNTVTSQCGCIKSKVVKRKFDDQEDTERARRRRRRVWGASGAPNAAQTLCERQRFFPARRVAFNAVALVVAAPAPSAGRAGPAAPAMDTPASAAAAAAEDED
jgi:hypothetical protein